VTLVDSTLFFAFISLREALILFLLIIAIFFLTVWWIGKRSKAVKLSKKS